MLIFSRISTLAKVVVFSVAIVLFLVFLWNEETSVEAFSVAPRSFRNPSSHRIGHINSHSHIHIHTRCPSIRFRSLQMAAASEETETEAETNTRVPVPVPVRNIVIAGGGIIGTSVAYYLVKDHLEQQQQLLQLAPNSDGVPISVTLVDPTGTVGSCASGKAGGFLARDWRDGTALQELQRKGFDLHQELANSFASESSDDDDDDDVDETENGTSGKSGGHPTDYRRLTCAAVAVDEDEGDDDEDEGDDNGTNIKSLRQRVPNKPPSKKLIDLEWVDPDVVLWGENENADSEAPSTGGGAVVPMGDETTIAQVHPRKLCETMWGAIATADTNTDTDSEEPTADSNVRVELVKGKIVRARSKYEEGGRRSVTGVELEDGRVLPSDVLVIACGPWTHEVNKWFAIDEETDGDDQDDEANRLLLLPDITAVKCHSILVPSSTGRPNTQAVFFDSNGAIGEDGDLEVYPRPDGDSYVNGFANEEGVCTERPGEEVVEEDKIELLRSAMAFVEKNDGSNSDDSNDSNDNGGISDELFERPAPRDHTQQVCYWPETPDGLPIIGKIPVIDGAYIAAGHSVWGILQGPATGKALAELVVNGESECVDLAPFGLGRFYA